MSCVTHGILVFYVTAIITMRGVDTKKSNTFFCIGLETCWDTRTRTRNDRTRICSVTITPYPNNLI